MARKVCPPLAGAINLATSLPWQIGGLLALIAYWVFHEFAASMALGHGLAKDLASFPQYLVPGGLLILALISFMSRRGPADPFEMVSPASDALAQMSLDDVEKLVAEAFRREGFLVAERAGSEHHGCVDLELFMGRDRYFVHCRRWQEKTINALAVRELSAAISAERAIGGFIVASGRLTDEARKAALGRAIRVIPTDSLRRLIKKVSASSSGEVTISPMFSRRRHDPAPPACPNCGKVMMRRMKKRGGTTVQDDWGCTSFPACQGRREV